MPLTVRPKGGSREHPTDPTVSRAAGGAVAFSPGNLSTSSSASSTLGSPENEEHILSFETIDKMRRASSYSSLNSLIGESACPFLLPRVRGSPPDTEQHEPVSASGQWVSKLSVQKRIKVSWTART